MSSSFGVGGVGFRTGTEQEKYVDTVAFGAYTREIINRAGLLDESLVRNQDDEYNYRLRKVGAKILLSPRILSRYRSRSTMRALWHQYFQYGYWKIRVMQKHPLQMQPRQFVPAVFIGTVALFMLAAWFSVWGDWLLLFLLGAYAVANVVASVLAARKSHWSLLPQITLAFGVLHFSYGFGFLYGLIKFSREWANEVN
jgi:succinoglycan biosynthesis protein ExoA